MHEDSVINIFEMNVTRDNMKFEGENHSLSENASISAHVLMVTDFIEESSGLLTMKLNDYTSS